MFCTYTKQPDGSFTGAEGTTQSIMKMVKNGSLIPTETTEDIGRPGIVYLWVSSIEGPEFNVWFNAYAHVCLLSKRRKLFG